MKKIFFLFLICSVFYSCKKEGCTDVNAINYDANANQDNGSCKYLPVLSTIPINYNGTNAQSGGIITSDGNSAVSVRGVCWSKSTNPTTSNDTTVNGKGTGTYNSIITNLDTNTKYYVRAYAINNNGTAYGDVKSFSTNSINSIYGCTDILALNYNPNATHDDGSCIYNINDTIYGCTDPDALNFNPEANFDDGSCIYQSTFAKDSMLINMVDNYILSAVNEYLNKVETLNIEIEYFTNQPNVQNLVNIRNAWYQALLVWQDVLFFSNITSLNSHNFIDLTNIYPVDTLNIEDKISLGNTTIETNTDFDTRGFQALDYLLNKRGYSDSELVNYLISSSNYIGYINNIIDDLQSIAHNLKTEWINYRNDFVADYESNSPGSATSLIVNQLCLTYEYYIRRAKVGLPLGVYNQFSSTVYPEKFECYHYGQSLPFLSRSLISLKNYINGMDYSSLNNGLGLDDYMDFVDAQYGAMDLTTAINNKFNEIDDKILSLNDPLSDQVIINQVAVQELYDKMHSLLPLLKADLTSALGVSITYSDNDGD